MSALAQEENQGSVIRVGCVDIDNFLKLSNGTATGYGADYLQKISSYTGWSYDYVSGTWSQCLQWLREGKIDLLLPAEYSEERSEDFLFSTLECSIDYVALMTNNDNTTLYYEDYSNYGDMVVGMIKDNYLNDCFTEYAEKSNFSFQTRYFETGADLMAALKDRLVDAIVTGNLEIGNDTKILAKFDYMPAYFITSKSNPGLMEQLNDALYRINLENPYFTAQLYEQYYAPYSSQAKVFTREEADCIAQIQSLRVVCDNDNFPFEWFDETTDSYRGIDVDILNRIAKNSGLKLEFIHTNSLRESWQTIRDGNADILAGVYLNEALSREYHVDGTLSYMDEIGNAIGKRGSSLSVTDIHTVAIRDASIGTAEYLRIHYPDWQIVTCDDTAACLNAVERGEADITFVGTYTLQTKPVLEDYPDLAILSGITLTVPMGLGVSKNAPAHLLPVLNKSILAIAQSEIQQIIMNNTLARTTEFSLKNMLKEHPATILVSAILCVLICFFILFLVSRSRMQKKYTVSLQDKNEQLVRANQVTSTFFSQLSHDMRTPMNAVLSFSRFGLESSSLSEARECLDRIQTSGQYLLNLINDTLEISKLDTGKLILQPEPYEMSDFKAALQNILQVKADEKGVTLEITLTNAEHHTALFDKLHLQQIFVNLLNNAIKFTPAGGHIRLLIDNPPSDDQHALIRFLVSDTGIGMERSFIEEKLYQPFEQERRWNGEGEIGTGLGLSIVKNLVGLMNGTITCESEAGKGTCFTVLIPTTYVEAEPEAQQPVLPDHSKLRGRHILLCEDHPLNREIIIKLLEKYQIEVNAAVDGREGLDLFCSSPIGYYDAVLMDLRMPVMDGLEAARRIRGADRLDAVSVPIIAITANVFEEDVESSKAAGMNAHLAKPIDPEMLYETLCAFVGKE
ncbi:MAG: transporter substrate-binding domain-containing protein [Lachnospiraceae bacterium]|nr:transporter substrate-binding domain-containing protein [Lachnospiraceae bacterium]